MKKAFNLTRIALCAAALLLAGRAAAADFGLETLSLEGFMPVAAEVKVPALPVKTGQPDGDDEEVVIGMDLLIRIPFKAVKVAVQAVSESDPRISIIDKDAPILVRSGEFLKIINLAIDVQGVIITPVITLKPYFEANDKLALRIQRVQLHIAATPDVKAMGEVKIDKDEMMAKVMDTVIAGVMTALDKKLAKTESVMTIAGMPYSSYKAADVLKMSYSKEDWILRAELSMKFIQGYLPKGLVGEFHLNGFSFNDTKIIVQFGTGE